MDTYDDDEKFLREEMGIDPGVELRELAREAPPPGKTGAGEASALRVVGDGEEAATPQAEAALIKELEQRPFYTPLPETTEQLPSGRASSWDGGKGIFFIEGIPPVSMTRGEVIPLAQGSWILDARRGRALLALPVDETETFFVFTTKKGEKLELNCWSGKTSQPAPDELARAIDKIAIPDAPALEVPAPEALLRGVETEAWLLDRARELCDAPGLMDRVASVGLVVRLGPATAAQPKDLLDGLLSGELRGPISRAREWARGLDQEVLEEIERQVLQGVGALRQSLRTLESRVAEGGETAALAARAVCHLRDELESAAWVLGENDRSDLVGPALESVDEEAAEHLSTLRLAADPADDLLSAVSWQEPDAWWGTPWTS